MLEIRKLGFSSFQNSKITKWLIPDILHHVEIGVNETKAGVRLIVIQSYMEKINTDNGVQVISYLAWFIFCVASLNSSSKFETLANKNHILVKIETAA